MTPGDAAKRSGDAAVTPSEALSESTSAAPKSGAARPPIDWSAVSKLEQEAWTIWLAWRRKSKFKNYVDTKMAVRLATYPPEIQLACIEESMTQNWQGLFPEKVKPDGTRQQGSESSYDRAGRKLREWAERNGVTVSPILA